MAGVWRSEEFAWIFQIENVQVLVRRAPAADQNYELLSATTFIENVFHEYTATYPAGQLRVLCSQRGILLGFADHAFKEITKGIEKWPTT